MSVTKEAMLGLKLRRVAVPAPEISPDAVVTVQEPDGATSERLGAADYPLGEDGVVRFAPAGRLARWAIACVVDDAGKPIFTDDDTEAIENMPSGLLRRVFNAARELDGATPAAVESEAKNS